MSQTDATGFERTETFDESRRVPESSIIYNRSKTDANYFTERHHFNLDEFEYQRDGINPGKVIIFNHEYFLDPKTLVRTGTRRDVNEIVLTFQRLGFNVDEEDILNDLTVEQIFAKLDSVLNDKKTLSEANALIIFVLTHGSTNNKLEAKDALFDGNIIWTKFNNCTELNNKPKMFIFQACKGKYYATTDGKNTPYNVPDEPSKLVDIGTFRANQLGKDMLLVYSTLEGNLSFRSPLTGTWFIQELCKNFSSFGRRDDVVSLITRTIKCVCGNYYDLDEYRNPDVKKQMPSFVSTLSKKFYLNRNKDRHLLLEISQKQDEILNLLEMLTKHLGD